MSSIKVVFGAAGPLWDNDDIAKKVLDILDKEGIKDIDTARLYPDSEERIGDLGAAARFSVGTKHPGGFVPETDENGILKIAEESLRLLQTDQVDVYYLHTPVRETPLEAALAGIDRLHKAGRFKRFGLSNFLPSEVEEVIRIAKEKNYVLPTVYQGNYSPVARKLEDILFPILRQHNIAFYAYSPLAGGFLTKTPEQISSGTDAGRFSKDHFLATMYNTLYNKPSFLKALVDWKEIAEEAGIPRAELAYRWVAYNSPLDNARGDAIILGGSNLEQLQQSLDGLKNGPLSDKVAKKIDAVWETVRDEAGLDNVNLNNA
ncbi:hypothetical protein G7Z17_g1812 [Cylindrodendrum hubeiense]|uniref:NADP-dependent oxidoreductase domain-containing protein n=1 Tax=Cylindrodendrum hubeiense TaxID=595255 RepID=A0A9P5LC79_9HYPO|nr:hypothetical protein G7Z17_g1812 [Cylindrodendrum hubeiense]